MITVDPSITPDAATSITGPTPRDTSSNSEAENTALSYSVPLPLMYLTRMTDKAEPNAEMNPEINRPKDCSVLTTDPVIYQTGNLTPPAHTPADNNNVWRAHCTEKKTPRPQPTEYLTNWEPPTNAARPPASKFLLKLTPTERSLLNEHQGCTRCRTFHAGHRANECPITANNAWPDAETYRPLTTTMAWTGAPHVPAGYVDGPQDEETDTYDPTSVAVPFTTPHLYAAMEVTGPAITGFPLHVKALLDIGCPAIMISDNLAKQLGSRRFPLPQE
ncbi:MAG TPA: hypothetical protein VGO47_11825, partial [Chlamydiales bacterium]|nr:hypothetical protein [Chlamydiales bacterium]